MRIAKPEMEGLGLCVVFRTESSSTPGEYHFTYFSKRDHSIDCTCTGWRMNKKCWHVDKVEEKLGGS